MGVDLAVVVDVERVVGRRQTHLALICQIQVPLYVCLTQVPFYACPYLPDSSHADISKIP
eukprot:3940711-Rhodomonas_salina.2